MEEGMKKKSICGKFPPFKKWEAHDKFQKSKRVV
jgi:hypothetical protein